MAVNGAVQVAREEMERRECCCWPHDQRRRKSCCRREENREADRQKLRKMRLGFILRYVFANGEGERDLNPDGFHATIPYLPSSPSRT